MNLFLFILMTILVSSTSWAATRFHECYNAKTEYLTLEINVNPFQGTKIKFQDTTYNYILSNVRIYSETRSNINDTLVAVGSTLNKGKVLVLSKDMLHTDRPEGGVVYSAQRTIYGIRINENVFGHRWGCLYSRSLR